MDKKTYNALNKKSGGKLLSRPKWKSYNYSISNDYSPNVKLPLYTIMLWLMVVVFFTSALHNDANPVDMFFGDGAGTGGILNIISDFGSNFVDTFNSQINTFSSWGLIGNSSDWVNLMGSILSISAFLFDLIIELLILIVRILVFVFTGGAVVL